MVRDRSAEHQRAMEALAAIDAPGQKMAILRQELDSMLRAIFLLSKPVSGRAGIISKSLRGDRWPVTDRDMVDLAQRLTNSTASVYKFGCGFIHLSAFHDHHNRNVFESLQETERNDILSHLRYYHGGPRSDSPTFADIGPLLPNVFTKIAGNLECYVEMLENGDVIEDLRASPTSRDPLKHPAPRRARSPG